MASSVAAREPLGRASLRAIQTCCITEPARIIYHCTRDIVRRLIFNRETASQRGVSATGKEAVKETGSETPDQKESHTLNDDEEQDYEDDNSAFNYDQTYDDDNTEIDYVLYMREGYDVSRRQRISYDGDNKNIQLAYSFSRYLVELLAVSPRFQFVGELQVYDYEYCLHYYCCPKRGEHHPKVDSQGNLIIHSRGRALQEDFTIEIRVPSECKGVAYDVGALTFEVDPLDCNNVITRYIRINHLLVDLTFIPMHTATQVDVDVTLYLISGSATTAGGTIYYVDGEISAHHQFYNKHRVVLFSCREEDKAKVINGVLPLTRNFVAVPVSLEPLLTIKLNLRVQTNGGHDVEGNTIPFQGEITFNRCQYEKIFSSDDHSQVKVNLSYR